MKKVGHGKLSLTRHMAHGFPQIELRVDVFQTEENELKFFYNPEHEGPNFLTIDYQSSDTSTKAKE